MSRAAKLPRRALSRIRPITGEAAEPARMAAADVLPWHALSVTVADRALELRDVPRGVAVRVEVLQDDRPITLVSQQATPTGSHVRLRAGDRVAIDVAKRGPRDVLVSLVLDGPTEGTAAIDVIVTLRADAPGPDMPAPRPRIAWETTGAPPGAVVVRLDHAEGGSWWLVDGHHACVDAQDLVSGPGEPTALVLRHHAELEAGQGTDIRLRLSESTEPRTPVGPDADATFAVRRRESDAWLAATFPAEGPAGGQVGDQVARRLAAELVTGEQRSRLAAALDAVALATLDPARARSMLLDSLAAWAHDADDPSDGPGAPPLEAWATLRVHQLLIERTGTPDPTFLEEATARLLTATSWWVDRLDPDGRNALGGGLPSIDGPRVLPRGVVDQGPGLAHADGAAWLAVHMVSMLRLATTVARLDRAYEDMAVTFLDTVVTMIDALDALGDGLGMWDQELGAYLDVARAADGTFQRLPLRSLVSLVPLLAVTVIPGEALERLPALADRVDGVLAERAELSGSIIRGHSGRRDRGDVLVSVVNRTRLGWALEHVLDPDGHLSPFGIRTLARVHQAPVRVDLGGVVADVRYRPAGGRDTDGRALWQGQVSVTLTSLVADALRAHASMRGSPLLLQYPTGSGRMVVADEVADDLMARVLGALGRLATDDSATLGIQAIDAESGGPARPRGVGGRSSLPLVALARTGGAR